LSTSTSAKQAQKSLRKTARELAAGVATANWPNLQSIVAVGNLSRDRYIPRYVTTQLSYNSTNNNKDKMCGFHHCES